MPSFSPAFLLAAAIAFVVGAIGSGLLVWKWKDGQHALAENAQLRADTKAWADIAEGQRQQHVEQTMELGEAVKRLSAISQGKEDDREELRRWMGAQFQALEALQPAAS